MEMKQDMADFFSDLTSVTLAKSLDAAGLRHRVIANNIANVETPGFSRSEVSFESRLREALTSGQPSDAQSRVESIEASSHPDSMSPAGPNGNNVSIDKEMTDLTKNTLEYEAIIRLMGIKGAMVMTAITEGKR